MKVEEGYWIVTRRDLNGLQPKFKICSRIRIIEMSSNMTELEEKIEVLKKRIAQKMRERGEAIQDDVNSWHDNSAYDMANEELMTLQARLRDLEARRAG